MRNLQSVLVIYNPNAMRGKVEEFLPHIRERLFLRYPVVDTIVGSSAETTAEIAFKNANKYDIIISLGGDGTLHQVVNGIMRGQGKCLIGVLPFGTCNDVAHTLQIPTELDKALDCILRLNTTHYDLMTDGENYIAYSLATGYLTNVAFETKQRAKKRIGRMAYFCAGLKDIFSFKAIPFTFNVDGERFHGKFAYIMLINGSSAGGFNINKGEDVSNGKVKFVAIRKTKGLGSFFAFVKLFLHGVEAVKKCKCVIVRDANKIEIENPSNEPFSLDGEKVKFLTKSVKVSNKVEFIKK